MVDYGSTILRPKVVCFKPFVCKTDTVPKTVEELRRLNRKLFGLVKNR